MINLDGPSIFNHSVTFISASAKKLYSDFNLMFLGSTSSPINEGSGFYRSNPINRENTDAIFTPLKILTLSQKFQFAA